MSREKPGHLSHGRKAVSWNACGEALLSQRNYHHALQEESGYVSISGAIAPGYA